MCFSFAEFALNGKKNKEKKVKVRGVNLLHPS